jgi:hypothetical protein
MKWIMSEIILISRDNFDGYSGLYYNPELGLASRENSVYTLFSKNRLFKMKYYRLKNRKKGFKTLKRSLIW